MGRLVFSTLVFLGILFSNASYLSFAEESASTVAGKTLVRTNKEDQRITTTYHADGTCSSSSQRRDGSCCVEDNCKWCVKDEQLCHLYEQWLQGKELCIPLSRSTEAKGTGSVAKAPAPVQRSCSDENALCVSYCYGNRSQESCFADCRGRQAACLQTGIYAWRNSPTRTGLLKK